VALQLDVSKNFYLAVPSAIVSHAILTTSIAEDEAETTEVIYWVRNNSQQFFSVQLPSKAGKPARLLSDAFVNGEPQQPSKRPDKNELLIRLPAREGGDEAFPVRFVYETPSPNPGQRLGWRGTFHIEPPTLGDTEALQTEWTLYLPRDFRYVKFGGAMRENVGDRGWDSFFGGLRVFVPHVGPALPEPEEVEQNKLPELPEAKTAGFDTQIQKEGVSVTLRRLEAPAAIAVEYRGKTYAATVEAIACLLAFFGGVRLLRRSRESRFGYFLFVGVGALIVAGAVNPRGAGIWQAIYMGVFLSVLVWFGFGFWKRLREAPGQVTRFFKRSAQPKVPHLVRATPSGVPPNPPPMPPPGPATGGPATAS
jgi:hypothetical protein